mmetsp:Transcript_150041/g.480521  ORF Transcript_150041/g.480521 Transcript_150041/m.480521 type:complete len:227 (+) Transcript_150041:181-861(+)
MQDAKGNELEWRTVPLHDAVGQGHAAIVQALLDAKADPLGYGGNNYLITTPFALAITNCHAAVAMLLAPLVAQAQVKRGIGPCRHVGALFDATGRGLTGKGPEMPEVLRALLQARANMNEADSFLYTPFIFAAISGKEEYVKILVEARADLDIQGSLDEHTALTLAVSNNHAGIVGLLVEGKADLTLKRKGKTAFELAVDAALSEQVQSQAIVRLLKQAQPSAAPA